MTPHRPSIVRTRRPHSSAIPVKSARLAPPIATSMTGLPRSTSFAAALLEPEREASTIRGLRRRVLVVTGLVLVAVVVGPLLGVRAGLFGDGVALAALLPHRRARGRAARATGHRRADKHRRPRPDAAGQLPAARRAASARRLRRRAHRQLGQHLHESAGRVAARLHGRRVDRGPGSLRAATARRRPRAGARRGEALERGARGRSCASTGSIAKDGGLVWIHDEASDYADGEIVHAQGYMLDITRRRLAEEELRALAVTDPLTDLPNRRQLLERLREHERASESQSLLFLDVDDFKTFNDSLGHRAGDALLDRDRRAASPLRRARTSSSCGSAATSSPSRHSSPTAPGSTRWGAACSPSSRRRWRSTGGSCGSAPASGSRPRVRPTSSSATPTLRCTARRRKGAAPSPSSRRTCTSRRSAASGCRPTCAGACSTTNSSSCTSPRSTFVPAGSRGSRRFCAGTIRCWGSCRRPSSSRSRRSRAASSRSVASSSMQPAVRRRSGRRCTTRS